MTKYYTNFSRTAIDHWDNHQAVREFTQNWLDSDGAQGYTIDGESLELLNADITVSNKMLMMGMSDKREDPSKRGRFGTGSIFAMCVLLARGIEVTIHNGNVLWTPRFEYCDKFEEDIMVIDEVEYYPSNHFKVTITGLSDSDMEDVIQTNLVFQNREVLASSPIGDIIESIDSNGEVYCGDLYVQQSAGFKYSYNIKPEYLTLNQDRASTSEWDLQSITSKLIMGTGDNELIKEAMEADSLDTRHVKYSWGGVVPTDIAEEYGQEFVEDHKATVVTSDYSEHQDNLKVGNKSVYNPNTAVVSSIQSSSVYQESIADIEIKEVPTVQEVVELLKERIMTLVGNSLTYHQLNDLETSIDAVVDMSYHWQGDVSDELPF